MSYCLFEVISNNSEFFLDNALNALVEDGKIWFAHYVLHESEKGEKPQWHIIISLKIAARYFKPTSLREYFIENGSCGINHWAPVRTGKWGGLWWWLRYAVHDPAVAEGKRQYPREAVKSTNPELLGEQWDEFVDNPKSAYKDKKSLKDIVLEAGETSRPLTKVMKEEKGVNLSPLASNIVFAYNLGEISAGVQKVLADSGIKEDDADYEEKENELLRKAESLYLNRQSSASRAVKMVAHSFKKTKIAEDVEDAVLVNEESEMTQEKRQWFSWLDVPADLQDFRHVKISEAQSPQARLDFFTKNLLARRADGDMHAFRILVDFIHDKENRLHYALRKVKKLAATYKYPPLNINAIRAKKAA